MRADRWIALTAVKLTRKCRAKRADYVTHCTNDVDFFSLAVTAGTATQWTSRYNLSSPFSGGRRAVFGRLG